MSNKETIWGKFLQPVFRLFIDEEKISQLYKSIDWEKESDRLRQPNLIYPDYYRSQNFHGIRGGYLTASAAVTYDPVTQYALPPNEIWVRQGVIDAIKGQPRRILDLGCGTGSTTLMLKQAFPTAEVTGIDLSPYMLVIAEQKAKQAGLAIQWRHDNAEKTRFLNASFDVVTASLLFHETPPKVAKSILQEAFRLLVPGGQVIILDGNQKTLLRTDWLANLFEEPYIKDYAKGSVDAWMGAAGFDLIRTDDHWWVHQVTRGLKALPTDEFASKNLQEGETGNTIFAPA
jgi:ubiquinone/menaquinone biosynthesis C-methylase UbiE